MVQMEKADQIEKDWIEAGSPPCSHSKVDKEYYLGSATGDFRCLNCGDTWSRNDPERPNR